MLVGFAEVMSLSACVGGTEGGPGQGGAPGGAAVVDPEVGWFPRLGDFADGKRVIVYSQQRTPVLLLAQEN